MSRFALVICLLLASGLTDRLSAQASNTPIGRTEWTNPDVSGSPPGSRSRLLAPRVRIVEREAVNTSAQGAADFFFVNQSRLLVGPSCRVVLDGRFYDAELDTEVKEFSLDTLLRCITKAENILADSPKDQIVLDTPRGRITIAGAIATVALSEDDAAGGLPKRGNPVSAPLQVTVSAVQAGGFVSLSGPGGQGSTTAVVRRAGFVLWVDQFGTINGPDRETSQKAAQLRAPLVAAVSRSLPTATSEIALSDAFILENPDTVRRIDLSRERTFLPVENCRADGCEGLFVTP
ncbi:MAG: hypothetical protein AB8B58_00770 [Roseobacter sp.]